MIYINFHKKFKITNPHTIQIIVKALIELENTLSFGTETTFEFLKHLKQSIEDEIETNDVMIIGLFGRVLNSLGENLKTTKQTRKKMRQVVKLMDSPQEEHLSFLRLFCLLLGNSFLDLKVQHQTR